jgi:membrane-associated phospholipid phosphatase
MTNEQTQAARLFVGAFIACAVLTLLSIGFVDRAVSTWSHATLHQPAPFEWLTHIIDPFVPAASIGLAAIATAAVFGWRPGPVGRTIVALCIAVLVATVLKEELKFLFGRTWPETWIANNPSWIKDGIYRFEPLHGGRGWASFPSGHMTTITAPCTVLWMLAPRIWRWLWVALILAVAIGLVGSDFHFVGDMIAGTFLGWACGIGAVALTRGLVNQPEVPERV